MTLRFWVVRDTRTSKVKKGFVYTTAQLSKKGISWTDNREYYEHAWHTFNVYARLVGE